MKKIAKIFIILVISIAGFLGTKIIVSMAIENAKVSKETSYIYLKRKTNLLVGTGGDSSMLIDNTEDYRLPVSLANQLDEPSLENGCEVTALSMLLNYYSYDYNKNVLQEKIKKEPYQDKHNYFGDPDMGFVGDASGKTPGSGVNVEPIYELATQVVKSPYKVVNSSGLPLNEILEKVHEGHPVWVITTIDYQEPKDNDLVDWPTRNGMKQFSIKHHAAVIIGFNQEEVFLNDPYGKEVIVKKNIFEQIYIKTGQQSLYIQ
ncbi:MULTISPECIES: C39 family peptidase [Vagococcus]|uniref:Peptidase C39-like domain-containing protein n=1 Tax=Vagococcus fluvialis bH819 TaxID=1255619 RepID=A0A1X6WN60_9ENTE|nr:MULTISPECIES: C39 family peptidase [Vagococcus]SLM85688.1 hypothetical protein FM121_06285 [Vagococcus fluvialis bH819]HCM90110.1 family C39 peptidase [Vagococcus sp.]